MAEHSDSVEARLIHDNPITSSSHAPPMTAPEGVEKAALTLGVGMWLVVLSLMGLFVWHKSDYFHHEGEYATGWVGYTEHTFIGLTVFTACISIGVGLSLRGATTIALYLPRSQANRFLFSVGLLLIGSGASGLWWGRESMKCLVVFCLDITRYIEVPHARPEAGLGFLSVAGMAFFFTLVPIGAVIVLARLPSRLPVVECHPLLFLVLAASLILVWSIVTFYVPNSWEYFVAARIANNAQVRVSTNSSECGNYEETTCPEVPWAKMRTGMVFISQSLILKLYPSNIVFFSYLILVLLFGRLFASSRGLRLFCQRCVIGHLDLSRGQFFTCILTVSMLTLFFYYWVHDHNYNGYWEGGVERGLSDTERWARSFGQLAVAFLSLLMFPASRFSPLHACLGTTWESTIWAHRALGYGMLAATLAHMCGWYYLYYQNETFPGDILSIPPQADITKDNFTVPLVTLATWFLFGTTGIFALWPLRRKMFNVFYMLHLLGFYCIIPVVLWHAAASWEYLIPGLTVWGLDRLARLYHSSRRTEIISVTVRGGVTHLEVHMNSARVSPGAYLFVSLPEISVLEWHPFTICPTAAEEGMHSIYIKATGDKTSWTRRATELLRRRQTGVLMVVDGPYGGFERCADFSEIVFVAGGIGITPCWAILLFLHRSLMSPAIRLTLVWGTREVELLNHFAEKLQGELEGTVTLRLFYTGFESSSISSHASGLHIENRRPNVADEIALLSNGESAKARLVFACGPPELVDVARRTAAKNGFFFHREVFTL